MLKLASLCINAAVVYNQNLLWKGSEMEMGMQIGVVGINYKSSDLITREMLTKVIQSHFSVENECFFLGSYVLLSTCNRMEIYFSDPNLIVMHSRLLSFLKEHTHQSFEPLLYSYFGAACFLHLCKVCSGLDSVIYGESEIQRQVKHCYQSASSLRSLEPSIHYIFQRALNIGKLMRTKFSLPRKQACLESLIHELIGAFVKKDSPPSILFVGNSEINRKVLLFLKTRDFSDVTLSSRSPLSAAHFCEKHHVQLLDMQKASLWVNYDVVISGTNQSEYVIKKEDTLNFFEPSNLIPTSLLIDLSMPRSIEPSLGKHPQITLFNIEEMNQLLLRKTPLHSKEKGMIVSFLENEVQKNIERYERWEKERLLCGAFC